MRDRTVEWFFAALGIPVGVIATRLDVALLWVVSRIRFGKLRLKGNWAEYVPDSTGRQYSLGTIEYDIWHKRYNLNGTNYQNDGTPFCHWKTVTSHLDRENGRFHYVFDTTEAGSLQISSSGYGVVNLERQGKELVPIDGYYVYVTSERDAISVSHTMDRMGVRPTRTRNVSAILDNLEGYSQAAKK